MSCPPSACADCAVHDLHQLVRLGVDMTSWDFVVALAGNPNTGKSTVFNALTGLRQHTGNWPGKTVTRAEGGFVDAEVRYKLVDLPGTYSLLSTSQDEEVARDFLLFGRPDVTIIVVDASRLERNLNLALQVLEITDRAVVCLNLIDEARRHGLTLDTDYLSDQLGVPVVATAARSGEGMDDLVRVVGEVAMGERVCRPRRSGGRPRALESAVEELVEEIHDAAPDLPNAAWIALRLLDGDRRIAEALLSGELSGRPTGELSGQPSGEEAAAPEVDEAAVTHLLATASKLRWQVGPDFHQQLMEAIYTEAARLADGATLRREAPRFDFDRALDRVVTSRIWGLPLMLLMLTVVFWLTVAGANVPSSWLATLLLEKLHPLLKAGAAALGVPWWIDGLVLDGMYLSTAWVVAVMLPPMAIFFPLFTLLEDFGYLPRVAFNLDHLFRRAGAHGKQALTLAMGFGCNAAGVVATRIIESPRERLIAILTNNFSLCNGRWPTQILIASIFLGALVPAYLAGLVTALAVVGVAVLGILFTFATSWLLSRTLLRGEVSAFSLELPPYRPPRFWQTLYTSLLDRTLLVLWRAVVFALPAGAVIWLLANIDVAGVSLAEHIIDFLDPVGVLLGLSGILLLAYIIAIPANEIVVPTVLMLTVLVAGSAGVGEGRGVLFELESQVETAALLKANGWTLLMAVNLMLFSLLHNPCSTTIYTIWKETRSIKWTVTAALMPLAIGVTVCFFVAQVWRIVDGA